MQGPGRASEDFSNLYENDCNTAQGLDLQTSFCLSTHHNQYDFRFEIALGNLLLLPQLCCRLPANFNLLLKLKWSSNFKDTGEEAEVGLGSLLLEL